LKSAPLRAAPTRTARSVKSAELRKARRAVEQAAKHFLRCCIRANVLSSEERQREEALLGIDLSERAGRH
jgi:hypothetical protein